MIVKWRKYMYLHIPRFSIIAINRSNAVALCLYWLFYPTQIVRIFQSLWIILAFSQLNSFLTFLFANHKSIMFSSEFLVRYFPIKGKKNNKIKGSHLPCGQFRVYVHFMQLIRFIFEN